MKVNNYQIYDAYQGNYLSEFLFDAAIQEAGGLDNLTEIYGEPDYSNKKALMDNNLNIMKTPWAKALDRIGSFNHVYDNDYREMRSRVRK